VPFSNAAALERIFGYREKTDIFLNLTEERQAEFPQEIRGFIGGVRNFVSCYSDGMLVACFNYCRPVTVYDQQVLKDLAMHSIFFETIAGQVKENEEAFLYTIKALARAAEANDEDTGNHIIRVNEYAYEIACELGLPEDLANEVRYSAQMHDVGKIHTPSSILQKPGRLTPEEWEEIKKHTVYGVKILGGSPRLEVARQIALNHHERWDGTGYPGGKKGEEIPLAARIVAICDVYDALRNKRVYKPAFDHETTCNIIIDGDGRTTPEQFDPEVYNIFRKIRSRFQEIYLEFKD
jgi:putative nucleotidyltransferase with HDIG domain